MQTSVFFLFVVAAAIGLLVGWMLRGQRGSAELQIKAALLGQAQQQLDEAQRQLAAERDAAQVARETNAALQARLDAEQRAGVEKVAALQEFEGKVKATFESLAVSALDANSQRLADRHRAELEAQQSQAKNDLAAKEASIASLLGPMRESLQELSRHSQKLEVQREGAYQAILTEVKNIQQSHSDLRQETTQLVNALRAPKVRGNWGEMQLRRCVEHAGMVEYASFEVEKFVRGEDSSVRPDLVVRLPNERCIVIDAKTPLDAFLNAGACEDEVERQKFLAEHASAVRNHLDSLASKAYWNRFKESPDFVVCFLPSEVLFSAALEFDPSLLEYSATSKVLLATPTTLIALLKAVAYGWQQAQTARDADLIREVATKLYKKFAGLHDSLLSLGSALERAGAEYNDVINKAEGHGGLFSIARNLRGLKIGEKDLAESKVVEFLPKTMQHDDWQPGLAIAASGEQAEDADAAN